MKKILFALLLFLATINTVSAATYETVSIGTNYKGKWIWDTGIDSSGAATNSYNKFNTMTSYTSFLYTKPNATLLKGTNITGTKVLETPIIHLAGHGNSNGMYFKYYNSADYETGVLNGYNSTSDGVVYAGIKSYDMSKVRLLIFQGCNTATNSTNIAKSANQLGAKTTLGWYDTISTQSNEEWINYFTSKLIQPNTTVSAALSYANSKSYSDSNVKKVNLYGNGNLTLVSTGGLPTPYSINLTNNYISDYNDNEYVVNLHASTDEVLNVASEYIKTKIDNEFDLDDFVVNKISESLYDLSYLIDGYIRTNMGYTIELEGNKISKIYNNMENVDSMKIETFKSNAPTSYANKVKKTVDEYNETYVIDKTEEFDYYDVNTNTVNHIIRITVRDIKTDTLGVYDEIIS